MSAHERLHRRAAVQDFRQRVVEKGQRLAVGAALELIAQERHLAVPFHVFVQKPRHRAALEIDGVIALEFLADGRDHGGDALFRENGVEAKDVRVVAGAFDEIEYDAMQRVDPFGGLAARLARLDARQPVQRLRIKNVVADDLPQPAEIVEEFQRRQAVLVEELAHQPGRGQPGVEGEHVERRLADRRVLDRVDGDRLFRSTDTGLLENRPGTTVFAQVLEHANGVALARRQQAFRHAHPVVGGGANLGHRPTVIVADLDLECLGLRHAKYSPSALFPPAVYQNPPRTEGSVIGSNP